MVLLRIGAYLGLFVCAASGQTINYDFPWLWSPQRQACAAMSTGVGANFNGFVAYSPDSAWRRNVTAAPSDAHSGTWLNSITGGGAIGLKGIDPIWRTNWWGQAWDGIPYNVVSKTTPKMDVYPATQLNPLYESYPSVSDPGPIPVPIPPFIQGAPGPWGPGGGEFQGDKHLIIFEKDNCILYEIWNTYWVGGKVYAGTVAMFDLLGGDLQRPWFWSSASVSGVPYSAGLIRYEEVAAGRINHALAFTALYVWGRAAATPPATGHQYNNSNNDALPPFGARLRLKPGFDIAKYGPQTRVILQALKEYGAIYVDGGHPVDLLMASDDRWDYIQTIGELGSVLVNANNFDFVQTGPIYSDTPGGPKPPAGAPPAINSFSAYPSTSPTGSQVLLFWDITGDAMRFVTPDVGAVRPNYAVVTPTRTTTYTLTAQNQFGRTSKSITVTVP